MEKNEKTEIIEALNFSTIIYRLFQKSLGMHPMMKLDRFRELYNETDRALVRLCQESVRMFNEYDNSLDREWIKFDVEDKSTWPGLKQIVYGIINYNDSILERNIRLIHLDISSFDEKTYWWVSGSAIYLTSVLYWYPIPNFPTEFLQQNT